MAAAIAGLGGPLAAQETEIWLDHHAATNEFVIRMGPVNLPAGMTPEGAGHDNPHAVHGHAVYPPVTTVTIPVGAYLTGFRYEIVDAAGRELPRELIHHLNIINPDYRELFLPISQRVLAVGKETGDHAMPRLLLGYPVAGGTPLVVNGMLHNPTGRTVEGAEVRVYLEYVAAGRPWPLFSVYPFQLDVAFPAGDKAFDLPPGTATWSYEARPVMAGRIMVIGGHLHPYATALRFEDVTGGEVIWEGSPIHDAQGELVGVTLGRLYRSLGAKITPDHVYRVSVTYHNPTGDTLHAGGMGVVGGVFLPANDGMWPRADTTDVLYALDRLHYLQQVSGTYEQIAGLAPGRLPAASVGHEHEQ